MALKKIPFCQLGKGEYNRPISRAHVNKIKREFHEDMVQPAIVSYRDGKYWIIDHQHQSQAIYELNNSDPNTLITCDVKIGLTYEQEADLYYRLNTGQKKPTFLQQLIGLIESRDDKALEFRDVVETCGYTIGNGTKSSLSAISTAWRIFNSERGATKLTRILTLTHSCWPDDKSGVDSRIIAGLNMFLRYHVDEFDNEQFVKSLSKSEPSDIANKATTFYKQMDSRSYTHPYCVYTEIIKRYNYGLRNNKLIPMPPKV